MSKNKYTINTYSFDGEKKQLGLRFFDSHVFEFDLPDKIQSYSYCVELMFSKDSFNKVMRKPYHEETIRGFYTGNLKDFEITTKIPDWLRIDKKDTGERKDFDWFKFLKTTCPKYLAFAKKRLNRKASGVIPNPVIYKQNGTGFRENNEFLEFDHSAYSWAGPFSLNDKKGCIMIYGENKHKCDFPVLNPKTGFRFYSLSDEVIKRTGITEKEHYSFSPEEKEKFFNSLTFSEQYHLVKRFFKSENYHLDEWIESVKPFKIYLAGNDDSSYTKWFVSEKEMNDEIKYLRKMQPLNFSLDITERGYIFTN